jgi:ribose transport system permease protein
MSDFDQGVESPPIGEPQLSRSRRARARARTFLTRYLTILAFAAVVVVFSLLKPTIYPTVENWQSMLNLGGPVIILACVLTVPLIMGDFDLSVGYNVQLMAAVVMVLISRHSVASAVAIFVTLVLGGIVGTIVGMIVTYSRASAFVITLGAGTVMLGLELKLSHGGKTIFEHIPPAYGNLALSKFLGVQWTIWIMLLVFVVLTVLTESTVLGRYIAAAGSNRETARLGGVNISLVRIVAFAIVGIGAATAAILLTSQANQYYPNLGIGSLLPAYAAVFLGATILRPGQFHIVGTFIGAIFLQAIQTGLILMNYSSAVADVIQGAVLILAVVLSRVAAQPQ